jgi:hypothetical protein
MSNTITVNNPNCVIKSLPAARLTGEILSLNVREGQGLAFRAHLADRNSADAVMVMSLPNNAQAYELGIVRGAIVEGVQTYNPRIDVYQRGHGIVDALQFPPFEHCNKAEDYLDRFAAVYRIAELKEFCDANGLAYDIVQTEEGELAIDIADASTTAYAEPELALSGSGS